MNVLTAQLFTCGVGFLFKPTIGWSVSYGIV